MARRRHRRGRQPACQCCRERRQRGRPRVAGPIGRRWTPARTSHRRRHSTGELEAGVWLEQRRTVGVSTRPRPPAVVEAQLDNAPVVVAVSHDGNWQLDATLVAVKRQHRLFDPAHRGGNSLDMADDGVALCEPGIGVRHTPLEGAASLDPATERVMELWLAGERPYERIGLADVTPAKYGTGAAARASAAWVRVRSSTGAENRSGTRHPRSLSQFVPSRSGRRVVCAQVARSASVGLRWAALMAG